MAKAELQRVEVRPGVVLKLTEKEAAEYQEREAADAERARQWRFNTQGLDPETGEPAEATTDAGPTADTATATDADEATVTAAPKPRSRKK